MNELKTNRAVDVDIAVPVLREPVAADGLPALLRTQLESMGLARIRRNDCAMAIRRLESYIATLTAGLVAVDEALLNAFEDWLVGGDESRRGYHRKVTFHLRSIINALPERLRNRRLLTNREAKRLDRFGEFDPETRRLFERFLLDGRKVKKTPAGLRATTTLLSPSVRDGGVYAAAMLLRLVGVGDIRQVTKGHVEQYLQRREGHRDRAVHTLWNMRPLFRHLVASGAVAEDPLDGLGRQNPRVDEDYVPADQMAKLADLDTLDMGDFRAVRDRLIAFALCYDFMLRVGEVARLRLDDVRVGEFVEVALRGEIQKGSGKPSVTLRNLFPESKSLFEAYLRLRASRGIKTDFLLASDDGRPLLTSGCRNAAKLAGTALGIVTHGGRVPTPHRYRHSLGTLNVGELGMRLSPYYLMRRCRHTDVRTTMQVYVTSNPLLDEAQHVAIVNAANGNGHAAAPEPFPRSTASDIRMSEMDAMSRVRSLGINWRSLRDHAACEKAAVERQGKTYYSESFIERLCTEWMTRDEAVRLMGLGAVSSFRYHVRNQGFRTLVIGRASLVRVNDVMQSIRGNGHPAT